jgi:hypothetical protein
LKNADVRGAANDLANGEVSTGTPERVSELSTHNCAAPKTAKCVFAASSHTFKKSADWDTKAMMDNLKIVRDPTTLTRSGRGVEDVPHDPGIHDDAP